MTEIVGSFSEVSECQGLIKCVEAGLFSYLSGSTIHFTCPFLQVIEDVKQVSLFYINCPSITPSAQISPVCPLYASSA